MITIRNAAGISLITDPDQHLTLEQAVGWLSDDSLPGGKSYPVPFPIAPNEAFLNRAIPLSSRAKAPSLPTRQV